MTGEAVVAVPVGLDPQFDGAGLGAEVLFGAVLDDGFGLDHHPRAEDAIGERMAGRVGRLLTGLAGELVVEVQQEERVAVSGGGGRRLPPGRAIHRLDGIVAAHEGRGGEQEQEREPS